MFVRRSMRFFFLLLLVACDEKKVGPPMKVGEIGAARFFYACGPDSDAQCNMDAELAPPAKDSKFPSIASGSKFLVTATRLVEAGMGQPLDVVPVSNAIVDVDPMTKLVVAKRPGWASFFAQQMDKSSADLTTLKIVEPKSLKILQATPDGKFLNGSITIGPNGVSAQANVKYTFRFRAIPLDDSGTILAGALPCQWTSSDPNVAKLTTPPQQNIAVVESGSAGTSMVKVTLGALTGQIVITVN